MYDNTSVATAYVVDIRPAAEDLYDYYYQCTYTVFTDNDIRRNFEELMTELIEQFNILFEPEVEKFLHNSQHLSRMMPHLENYIQLKWFSWSSIADLLAKNFMNHLQLFYYHLGGLLYRYVGMKDQAAYVFKYYGCNAVIVMEYVEVPG